MDIYCLINIFACDQPRGLVVRVSDSTMALTWEFFLVGEDPHGDHGLGS